jgi:biotin operon repressor
MAQTPDDILRALADPERLAIAGALALADATSASLAASLDLSVTRIRKHLNRLSAAGVARLQSDRKTYRLDPETLRWAAEQVGPPREAGLPLGAATEDEEQVLRTFFRNGRLTEMPIKRGKRRIVLERIALEFEPGERYDEKQVNVIVGGFFNDHAAVRRYLVEEGFLAREKGVYWRTGGRVDVEERHSFSTSPHTSRALDSGHDDPG